MAGGNGLLTTAVVVSLAFTGVFFLFPRHTLWGQEKPRVENFDSQQILSGSNAFSEQLAVSHFSTDESTHKKCRDSPIVIAHRGASGVLPEETLAAYELAIVLNANNIECDAVLTKDGVPICRHEPNINSTSNVNSLPQFSGRARTYTIDDSPPESGFFTVDFNFDEILQIRAKQRLQSRDPFFNGEFPIPSLNEYLCLIVRVNIWRQQVISMRGYHNRVEKGATNFFEHVKARCSFTNEAASKDNVCKCVRRSSAIAETLKKNFILGIESTTDFFLSPFDVFEFLAPQNMKKFNLTRYKDLVGEFLLISSKAMDEIIAQPSSYYENGLSSMQPFQLDIGQPRHLPISSRQIEAFCHKYSHYFGAYIESKHSAWTTNILGKSLNDAIISSLHTCGFFIVADWAFLQSFDMSDLRYFKEKTPFPLIQLIFIGDVNSSSSAIEFSLPEAAKEDSASSEPYRELLATDLNESATFEGSTLLNKANCCPKRHIPEELLKYLSLRHSFSAVMYQSLPNMSNSSRLDFFVIPTILSDVAKYSNGIGPSKKLILSVAPETKYITKHTLIVEVAHYLDLLVHPWTFSNEYTSIPFTFALDPYREIMAYTCDACVDGVFTDFPGTAAMALHMNEHALFAI